MRPHPRIRKTAKWGGAAATVLLVLAWIVSCFRCSGWWATPGLMIGIDAGQLVVYFESGENDFGSDFWNTWHPFEHTWARAPWIGTSESGNHFECLVDVPLWALAASCFAASVIASRLDRLARAREQLNLCAACRFDLSGLRPGTVCPECGTSPALVQPQK